METLPRLLFLLYEAALFVIAWRLAAAIGADRVPSRAWMPLCTVAVKLYVGALLSVVMLFVDVEPVAGFRALCGALTAAAIVALLTAPQRSEPAPTRWTTAETLVAIAIAAIAASCLAGSAYPLREYDSLHNFNWIIRWIADGRSPYEFAFNYVSFWEASYVPGIVLGESRYLHVWVSAQALLLYVLALYVLARGVGLNRLVGLAIVAAATFVPWHWGWAAGVPTLKNDTLANAGFLTAMIVVVQLGRRASADWREGALLGIAVAFMTVKFSGVVIAVPFLVAALLLPLRKAAFSWRAALAITLVAIGVAAIGTGHFYLKNLVAYGNPLYPYALTVGPLALAGTLDTTGTSILANLGTDRATRILLGLDPAGQPQLVLVRAGVGAAIVVVLLAGLRSLRGSGLVTVALLALWGWLVWVLSSWSAGIAPGNLVYLEDLKSLRYATGAAGASLVILAAAMSRIAWLPPSVIAAPFLVSASVLAHTQLTKYQPLGGWAVRASLVLAACVFVVMVAAMASRAAQLPITRRAAALAMAVAGVLTLFRIEPVARLQADPFAGLRSFADSVVPARTIIYRPKQRGEASFFTGLGYHMLERDLLAVLPTLAIHDEAPPALPTGRDGDLLVIHGGGPTDTRFAQYKAAFEQRLAGTPWKPAYADVFGVAYRWTSP